MPHKSWIIVDLESCPDDSALPLMDLTPEPAKNLVDPVKIQADIAAKKAAALARMSLDPFALRIACLGWTIDGQGYELSLCRTVEDERTALEAFAQALRCGPGISSLSQRHIIGFNVIGFDLPAIITRARLLGVSLGVLPIDMRKYGNHDVTDLQEVLTFYGNIPEKAFSRSLTSLARRHGIIVTDETKGRDIPQMVAEGRWDAVAAHCRADLETTYALAVACGVVAPVTTEVSAF